MRAWALRSRTPLNSPPPPGGGGSEVLRNPWDNQRRLSPATVHDIHSPQSEYWQRSEKLPASGFGLVSSCGAPSKAARVDRNSVFHTGPAGLSSWRGSRMVGASSLRVVGVEIVGEPLYGLFRP